MKTAPKSDSKRWLFLVVLLVAGSGMVAWHLDAASRGEPGFALDFVLLGMVLILASVVGIVWYLIRPTWR